VSLTPDSVTFRSLIGPLRLVQSLQQQESRDRGVDLLNGIGVSLALTLELLVSGGIAEQPGAGDLNERACVANRDRG
jgi:hypothetical protein